MAAVQDPDVTTKAKEVNERLSVLVRFDILYTTRSMEMPWEGELVAIVSK